MNLLKKTYCICQWIRWSWKWRWWWWCGGRSNGLHSYIMATVAMCGVRNPACTATSALGKERYINELHLHLHTFVSISTHPENILVQSEKSVNVGGCLLSKQQTILKLDIIISERWCCCIRHQVVRMYRHPREMPTTMISKIQFKLATLRIAIQSLNDHDLFLIL